MKELDSMDSNPSSEPGSKFPWSGLAFAGSGKIIGVAMLLAVTCIATSRFTPYFLTGYNIENLLRRTSLFGIISIGAAFVIMVGGIDLSIGSVIALVGCLLPWLLVQQGLDPWIAVPLVLILGPAIGLFHGTLVRTLRLQPFIVTLCGLLLYRGIARGITADQTVGFQNGFKN